MTDINFEIRADSFHEDPTSNNQSFESILDILDTQTILQKIYPKNIFEFLGDSEESTEISSIVFNLNTISNSCRKPERENLNLDMDDSKSEILQILKFKGRTNTSSMPFRQVRNNVSNKNFGPFGGISNFNLLSNGENKVKKISLAGRVLKSKDTNEEIKNEREINFNKIPERLKNPIKINNNF